jgi:hypothetical protein
MPSEQRRQLIRQARDRPAPLTLVLASLVSAGAAVAGLDVWVAIVAAGAAVFSGAQVVRTEVVVPARTKATVRAAVPFQVHGEPKWGGTAVQYKPGRWLTAAYAVPANPRHGHRRRAGGAYVGPHLLLGGDWAPTSVIYRDESTDLAVLDCPRAHPWLARLAVEEPEEGEIVRVIGWRAPGAVQPRIRVALDYTIQSETDAGELVVTGPNPQLGFAGAPAVELTSGRTLGVLVRFHSKLLAEDQTAEPLQEVYVASVRNLPDHLR